MRSFFQKWDMLEAMNPFGVAYFAGFFMEHGVPRTLAFDIDQFLFLDLLNFRQEAIRRIKAEARVSREVFWVHVDLDASLVSFQISPSAPFVCSIMIDMDPVSLVRLIYQYFLFLKREPELGKCFATAYVAGKVLRCQ
jgi:hypothetical protein